MPGRKTPVELSRILLGVESPEDLRILIEGLLTPKELAEVLNRWRLMLKLAGGQTQREIAAELGISLGKIARGSRLLQYGPRRFRQLVQAAAKRLAAEEGERR